MPISCVARYSRLATSTTRMWRDVGNWTARRPRTMILYPLRGPVAKPSSGPRRAERAKKRWEPVKGSAARTRGISRQALSES